jgi:hypothetical protein
MRFFLVSSLLLIGVCSYGQNITDANGNKQGVWAYEVVDTVKYTRISNDEDVINDEITEYKTYNKLEGEYLDNEKTGVWTSRDYHNHILSTITYQKGKPVGEVKVFYRYGIRYKGVIKLDSKIVELETKAEAAKYWATIKMDVSELIKKWTFIED